jgi:hypothetical protein
MDFDPLRPDAATRRVRHHTLEVTNMADTLTLAELDQHEVSLLEPRETLAFANFANVTATNLALAINAATFQSNANAWAGQAIYVWQS